MGLLVRHIREYEPPEHENLRPTDTDILMYMWILSCKPKILLLKPVCTIKSDYSFYKSFTSLNLIFRSYFFDILSFPSIFISFSFVFFHLVLSWHHHQHRRRRRRRVRLYHDHDDIILGTTIGTEIELGFGLPHTRTHAFHFIFWFVWFIVWNIRLECVACHIGLENVQRSGTTAESSESNQFEYPFE